MPRDDSRYRGQPLSLAFEVGFQRIGSVSYEWIQHQPYPAGSTCHLYSGKLSGNRLSV
jgi:hypothetical protein